MVNVMYNRFNLNSKVIVITGGAGYLGTSIAFEMVKMGGVVVIADICEPGQEQFPGELRDQICYMECNAYDTDSIKQMFKKVEDRLGKINVLVNAAYFGADYGAQGSVDIMSDEIWEKGINGSLGVVFKCTREVIPYMKKNKGGSIVNFASMYGIVSPDPGIYGDSGANNPASYGCGKAGVLQFTRYCAAHFAKDNIRVNSITPGPFPNINSKIGLNEKFIDRLSQKTMLGRIGKPEEVAGAVILLASDASSYMTGSNIAVDGGWTAW